MSNDHRPVSFGRMGNPMSIILVGVGLLIIGAGANGIRSNDTIVEQMPYILTGGVLGVAFVIFGSAFMVVQNARQDRVLLEIKLSEIAELLAAGGTAVGGPLGGGAAGGTRAVSPGDVSGLVVAGTASFHVPGCRLVDGREEVNYLTPAEAQARDLKACRVCQPESANTNVTVR